MAGEEKGERKMKTYYFPINPDTAFGNSAPVCVDKKEAERLMREWYGPYSAPPQR